jgi:hypothetical protein
MSVSKYEITAFNKKYYCKVTKYPGSENKTFSFGGANYYCVIIAVKEQTSQMGYLDRMEYNRACVKDGKLEHKEGTAQLGIAALWTFHTLFPEVKTLTLTDDSHIHCEEDSKQYRMNLSYDYIVKHNKTWYEDKFNAKLPEPLFTSYKESCKILDLPLDPFEFQSERMSELKKYETAYRSASTPREFINSLRKDYGKQYCIEVSRWLSRYIELLPIQTHKQEWFILMDHPTKPTGYSIEPTTNSIRGGGKTRKTMRIPRNFSIVSGGGEDEYTQIVGYYSG